jgi:hypothetical protein
MGGIKIGFVGMGIEDGGCNWSKPMIDEYRVEWAFMWGRGS